MCEKIRAAFAARIFVWAIYVSRHGVRSGTRDFPGRCRFVNLHHGAGHNGDKRMKLTTAIGILGLVGAMIVGNPGAGFAGTLPQAAAVAAASNDAAALVQQARYRRHHGYRRGRGDGYSDPRRTHRPFDTWDAYGKRWD
jgi:hypothetical protein